MKAWRLDTFQSMLGDTLIANELNNSDAKCELKVNEVIESKSLGEGWETFSVILGSDQLIGQGSVEIQHEEYGSTTVFLNPKSNTEHEAIFSYQL